MPGTWHKRLGFAVRECQNASTSLGIVVRAFRHGVEDPDYSALAIARVSE